MEMQEQKLPAMAYAMTGLGVVAAAVLLGVSATMNFKFGQSLGRTGADGLIYGMASVAADCFKALSPFFFFAAVRNRSWSQALAAAVVGLVTMAYSMTSAVGHAALNRLDTTSQRTVEATSYKDLRAELARLAEQRAWIPQHRPAATVQADLDGMKTQRTWTATAGCTDATQKASREFCQSFHKLGAELASAQEASRIEAKLADVTAKITNATSGTVMAEADPQASVLSKLTGLKIDNTQIALMLFVVLLIEVGSGFGFYVSFSYLPDRPTRKRIPEQAPSTDEQAATEPAAGHNATVVPFPLRQTVSEASQEVKATVSSDVLPYTKERAEADLRGLTATLRLVPSQDVLAVRWGVGKGTVSKWIDSWEWVGRARVGRMTNVFAAKEVQQSAAA